jgi:hypothetical protein
VELDDRVQREGVVGVDPERELLLGSGSASGSIAARPATYFARSPSAFSAA